MICYYKFDMIEENKPKPVENNYIEEDKPSKSQRNVNYKHKKKWVKIVHKASEMGGSI